MAEFIAILFLIVAVAFVVFFVWMVLGFMRWMWRSASKPLAAPSHSGRNLGMSAEEEGNVHSGPYGYSPNTAYPETQYGSLFNPDAEWNHEEQ
jgi:hypothetical protein